MTGRVNPAIVSFLAGCHSRERLRFIDVRHLREQAHICFMARRNSRVRHDCFVNPKTGGSCGGVCWFSMTSVKLSADSVDEGKRVRWNKEKTPLENEVNWLAQVFIGAKKKSRRFSAKESSVLGKRIVGSRQKNRRFSAKESTMLRESSQYTLRNHLTAMHR